MPTNENTLSVQFAHKLGQLDLDISFQAPPGITILFGPSGSGKSTSLWVIAGLLKPKKGRVALGAEVWFDSRSKVDVPPHERHVAFVFQSLALFPHMTALANVAYGIGKGESKERRIAEAQAMLVRMRVGHLEDRKPPTFSGGEAQRVALARAFAQRGRALLLDEPFSALDEDLKRELLEELRGIALELDVPVLHVTHSREEARALGQRVVRVARGRVSEGESLDDL